ncbi:MAG: grasp-with-spasm system ATP-grasp peptide maturase [Phycisphaerales bacterium]|nr:grasp-with-spasm system ATP-grasp peptide maturase [Phycisphaerales bacterium]
MVLIQSTDKEHTTDTVIDWLYYMKKDWVRNNNLGVNIEKAEISNSQDSVILQLNNTKQEKTELKLEEIKAYWYRRGHFNFGLNVIAKKGTNDVKIASYLSEEIKVVKKFVFHFLSSIKHINLPENNDINKLIVLFEAKYCGLKIPDTFLLTNKKDLNDLLNKRDLITKSFYVSGITLNDKSVSWGTQLITKDSIEFLNNLKDKFYPSLLQNCVEKLFEIRTFYFDNRFFSSAVLSQNDEQTKIDFRNYNQAKPNRTPPYQLPIEIEEKLRNLFAKLGINSGSIDLILGTDNCYYFLEINPIGQFWQVSHPCNYYIEKQIAHYL